MKKNDRIEVQIDDLTYEGMGVAKVDGFPLFIENALPGEKVVVHVLKIGKKFGYAKVVEWVSTSPDRIPLVDPNGTRVGTMPLQHMKYKAQIPVRMVDGLLTTGFFKKNSHDLVPIEDFHIQDPEIDRIILVVRDILRKFAIEAYDEEKHTGDLRHIIVRRGLRTSQVMIILVTRTEKFVQKEAVVEQITQQLPEVVSIVQNIQPHQSNVIMGSQKKVLFGEDAFQEALMEFTFTISSRSFFQVNTIQTEVLYHEAIQAAGLTGDETVVDAYCGIGTMSLAFAKCAKKVYAMEIVPDAIQMAKENARINQIDNVTFEVGAAEKVMPTWVDSGLQPDVIVVDPPRKGLDGAFIDAAVKTKARKIVYVSCNPATLARDLALFQEKGYQALYAQPVDMFPMTTAIETVAVLERMN